MDNPLLRLAAAGQSVWLDFIHRKILEDGELKRLISQDGVTGVTSNPSIFEQSIGHGTDYDDRLQRLLGLGVEAPVELYERLAIIDVRAAADQLRIPIQAGHVFRCEVGRGSALKPASVPK